MGSEVEIVVVEMNIEAARPIDYHLCPVKSSPVQFSSVGSKADRAGLA